MTLLSCSEESDVEASDITGHWEVVRANKNGKPTGLLKGAYFKIDSDSTMATNIIGEEVDGPFTMAGAKLYHKTEHQTVYYVEYSSNDSMDISASIMGLKLQLFLKRKQEEG